MTITYNLDGGSFPTGITEQISIFKNAGPKLYKPVKTNSLFLGWFTNSAKTSIYIGEPISSNITLYAKWSTTITEPQFIFTSTENTFITDTNGVSAMLDFERNIIWFSLGNGLTVDRLSILKPTI